MPWGSPTQCAPAGGAGEDGQRARPRKKRRLYKSESEGVGLQSPPLQPQARSHADARRPLEAKPFPVGIRTIGSFHGAMTNSRLNGHLLQASLAPPAVHRQEAQQTTYRVQAAAHATFRQQKAAHCSPWAARGRRRALSTPVFSPLVVGGENYSLTSPSARLRVEDRGRVQYNRFHHPAR